MTKEEKKITPSIFDARSRTDVIFGVGSNGNDIFFSLFNLGSMSFVSFRYIS